MDGELTGKVALVTGASRGIGRAIAVKLASRGANVVVNYRSSSDEAGAAVAEIEAAGGKAIAVQADVADRQAVKRMVATIVETWEKIDILVNNAGITRDGLLLAMSDQQWNEVLDTSLRGAFLCCQLALRSMINQGGGRIINIASMAGLVGNAGQANYSAAKGGLIAFSRSLARELGRRGITVNAVAPGFIQTGMTSRLSEKQRSDILGRIALGRYGSPDDVAELVAFLASARAGYITGQVIGIDGGIL